MGLSVLISTLSCRYLLSLRIGKCLISWSRYSHTGKSYLFTLNVVGDADVKFAFWDGFEFTFGMWELLGVDRSEETSLRNQNQSSRLVVMSTSSKGEKRHFIEQVFCKLCTFFFKFYFKCKICTCVCSRFRVELKCNSRHSDLLRQ